MENISINNMDIGVLHSNGHNEKHDVEDIVYYADTFSIQKGRIYKGMITSKKIIYGGNKNKWYQYDLDVDGLEESDRKNFCNLDSHNLYKDPEEIKKSMEKKLLMDYNRNLAKIESFFKLEQ